MTTPTPSRRPRTRRVAWSLRTTLTATIAGLFIVATGTVLSVQVLITTRALDQQVQTISIGNRPDATQSTQGAEPPLTGVSPNDEAEACASNGSATSLVPCDPPSLLAPQDDPAGASGVSREVSTLRDSVTTTMLTSSIIIFAAFSALALLIAWFVATHTTRRITAITTFADQLDPNDPSGRIPATSASDEIGQLTDTLNGALDRIEHTVSAQKQFISNASHELRTPIAAIETSLDAPLSQGRFPADVQPAVHRALAANRKSANLVTSLLQLARAQGQPRAAYQPVDLADLTRRLLADLGDLFDQKCLVVDTSALQPVTVDADPVLLELAIRNVLDNAITHNATTGQVTISVTADTSTATLTITNTTAGAGTTDVGLLVQPFQRGDNTRLTGAPGFGIGLAIVDAIARAHGARLDLSRPTPSTFQASLTMAIQQRADILTSQSKRRKQGRGA